MVDRGVMNLVKVLEIENWAAVVGAVFWHVEAVVHHDRWCLKHSFHPLTNDELAKTSIRQSSISKSSRTHIAGDSIATVCQKVTYSAARLALSNDVENVIVD